MFKRVFNTLSKRIKKQNLILYTIAFLVTTGIVTFVIISNLNNKTAEAAWFDDTFAYRQTFTFTGGSAFTSERRVSISINTSALIAAAKMLSTCADTRFTDQGGKNLKYQLTGTCNNTATTYDVVFTSINSDTNYGYFYYGNPSAVSQSQNVSGITALGGGAASNGGPVKVDDASNFYISSNRQVFRTSTGTLYTIFMGSNSLCQVWKSTDGTSWSEQHTGGGPDCGGSVQAAIDSTNVIHFFYRPTCCLDQELYYGTFYTSSDSFTAYGEQVNPTRAGLLAPRDITIDSNNIPHVVYEDNGGSPVANDILYYSNRVGGSWDVSATAITTIVNTSFDTTISIDLDNKVEVGFIDTKNSAFKAAIANANDASSFTVQTVDSSANIVVNTLNSSIAVDSSGNTWVSYVDENGASDLVTLSKHTYGSAWSAWETSVTDSHTGKEPSTAIVGSDIYIFYQNSTDDIVYDLYNGSWSGETTLQTGTFTDVVAKWAYLNDNQQSTQIDYLYADATDVYWASLGLAGGGPTVTFASEENGPGPKLWWSFSEGYGSTANDGTIQNNDGTITNAQWKSSDFCISDNCMFFDGSGDHVSKTYSSDTELDVGTSSFSLGLWFKHSITISGTDNLVSRASGTLGSEVGYKIYMNSSGFMCLGIDSTAGSFPSDSACSTTSYADAQWHHLMAVKSGTSSITLYIDGHQIAQDASLTSTGSLSATSPVFRVGIDSDASSNGWDGYVDEVKFFNFAKTVAQVTTEVNSKGTAKGGAAQFGNTDNSNLTNGLLGYWKFDEDSGNAQDSSGNGLVLIPTGTSVGTGKFGNGRVTAATNNYLGIAATTPLNFTSQTTFSSWVYLTAYPASGLGRITGRSNSSFELAVDSTASAQCGQGKIAYYTAILAAWQCTSYTLELSQWYLITTTFNGTNWNIYVNGNNVTTSSNTTINIGGSMYIGAAVGGVEGFPGTIDEARFYNRALTQPEITQLYNWAPRPIAYYKLDETSGTTVYDSSGNNYNGLARGTATLGATGKFGRAVYTRGDINTDISLPLISLGTTNTVSFWLNPTNDGTDYVPIGNGSGVYAAYINDIGVNGSIYYSPKSGNSVVVPHGGITPSTFSHLEVVRDGTSVKFYKNGVQIGTTQTLSANDSLPITCLTNHCSGARFPQWGYLDEVKLYDYARTPSQVIQDMNGDHPLGGSPIASQTVYWPLDETYGSTAHNANPIHSALVGTFGTGNSAPTWLQDVSCVVNGCIALDAAQDNISAGNLSIFDSLPGMTISFWLNPLSLATDRSIVSKNDASQRSFAVTTDASSSSELRVHIAATVGEAANTTYFTTSGLGLTASTWQHILVTYDGSVSAPSSRIHVYKNGLEVSGSTTGTPPANMTSGSTSNLKLGNDDSTTYTGLIARIDEFKIYTATLPEASRLIDYNGGNTTNFGGGVTTTHDNEGFGGSGPIGWWKFDEKTGTNAYDYSGSENTGALGAGTSSPTWTMGKVGGALQFDGVNDYVNAGSTSSLDDLSNVTLEAWVKPTSTSGYLQIIDKAPDAGPTGGWLFELNMTNNGVEFWADCNGSNLIRTANNVITPGVWQHVAMTWDRSCTAANVTMYINGKIPTYTTTTNGSSITSDAAYNLTIGMATGGGDPFKGLMDDIKIYNYQRSQAQIAYDYNRGAPVAHYQFDEGSGTTLYNNARTADGLAAGLDGTLNLGASGQTSPGDINTNSVTPWYNGRNGKFNTSLNFDGTDDYVAVTDSGTSSPLDFFNGQDITISAWFNTDTLPSSGTYRAIVTKGDVDGTGADLNYIITLGRDSGTSNIVLDMCYTNDVDSYNCYTTPTTSSLPISTGSWYHVTYTYTFGTASTARIYLNGVLQPNGTWFSGTGNDAPNVSDEALWIGADNYSGGSAVDEAFDGRIDDVRIYRYTLTQSQILNVINESSGARFGPTSGSP